MISARPITPAAFAPYGEVIETKDHDHILINEGLCKRFTDLAAFDIEDGHLGLSLFQSELRSLPYACTLMERHPKGSQCFIPQGDSSYLVIVARDDGGRPATPEVFLAAPHQSINIARNVWHGVLAPISGTGLFAVLDRIGAGTNLEEYTLAEPIEITVPDQA